VPPAPAEPRPRHAWTGTVVYEAHVKGLTRLHPAVPPELRGTYLGLASPPVLEHLRGLGVTTLELLPVQHHVSEARLAALGLTNYWGYSPVGFFAPHAGYATADDGRQAAEFREMVRALHEAGFEVVLDLVFNHCGEGPLDAPTLSLRGIDNAGYYRLQADEPARLLDLTGCGNTLATDRPLARRLFLDGARWWIERYGVDGFRLDLAPALFRDASGRFDRASPLFAEIAADPLLSGAKWIVEPWDLGPSGQCQGRFPPGWAEWNGRFRDAVRRFWRGDPGAGPVAARELAGGHARLAVDYVTCHDGFTLADLVSYDRKRNEANGEANHDGSDADASRSWGAEGPTARPEIRERRRRVRESLLGTLLLARGVPMLAHGDELGRTQRGNNNAYCHDGALTWVRWDPDAEDDLRDVIRALTRLRRSYLPLAAAARAGSIAWRELRSPVPSSQPPGLVLALADGLALVCNPGDAPLPLPEGLRSGRMLFTSASQEAPAAPGRRAYLPAHALALVET
jgi:glycogen operon protein